ARPRARRRWARRSHPRALPHLLSRRTRRMAPTGLWLRRVPGLRAAGERVGRVRQRGPVEPLIPAGYSRRPWTSPGNSAECLECGAVHEFSLEIDRAAFG